MIIREIKQNPEKVLKNFDWFNDYSDTLHWAKVNCYSEIVEKLRKGYKEWLQTELEKRIKTD